MSIWDSSYRRTIQEALSISAGSKALATLWKLSLSLAETSNCSLDTCLTATVEKVTGRHW